MEFRIADSFIDSLAKLNGQEQKAVKNTSFDLQVNPAHPGMQFHKLKKSKDENFWSVRVNQDLRIIVHRTEQSLLLCYVDHHDDAYAWAARRRIERHPRTGAAQMVEIRETMEQETSQPASAPQPSVPGKSFLFAEVSDDTLLDYGVPSDWLEDVRQATEDSILHLIDHLPQEAAEALLDLATGTTPQIPAAETPDSDPFNHPDAQRRFRVLANQEELERALEFPWEKWTVFLHPTQQSYVERAYSGPTRISGSAGTGKTIVALHRAVHLAHQNPQARILLTTFSKTLANALKRKLFCLIGRESALADRIHIQSIQSLAYSLYTKAFGQPNLASANLIRSLLKQAAADSNAAHFTEHFLFGEWTEVVDAWQLRDWQAYRDVPRLGRKTRIGGRQREELWTIFEQVRRGLAERNIMTWSGVFAAVTQHATNGRTGFEHVIVDEAQDMGVAEMRLLAVLGGSRPDGLFFTGDLGQRIFQQPYSWKALGVDVRGRSHRLRICYRTSHQIRRQADLLLPGSLNDVDGIEESRKGTVSIFNGPPPQIETFSSQDEEARFVGEWIEERLEDDGLKPHEIGLFVRDKPQIRRARQAASQAGVQTIELSDKVEVTPEHLSLSPMHLAKGLEFRAVAVMACDDEIVPLQERIDTVFDESDLEEVYNTERHLLYVACTRARDQLLVTAVDPASEFLDDMDLSARN